MEPNRVGQLQGLVAPSDAAQFSVMSDSASVESSQPRPARIGSCAASGTGSSAPSVRRGRPRLPDPALSLPPSASAHEREVVRQLQERREKNRASARRSRERSRRQLGDALELVRSLRKENGRLTQQAAALRSRLASVLAQQQCLQVALSHLTSGGNVAAATWGAGGLGGLATPPAMPATAAWPMAPSWHRLGNASTQTRLTAPGLAASTTMASGHATPHPSRGPQAWAP